MPNNTKANDGKGGDQRRQTPDDKFIELTSGRLFVSTTHTVRQILKACEAVLSQREKDAAKGGSKTTEQSVVVPPVVEGDKPTKKEPKWHQTEFGKSLKILEHVNQKVKASTGDQQLVIGWKNVLGSVGAAIARAKHLVPPVGDDALRTSLDETISDPEREPSVVIAEVGKLFHDANYTPLTQEQKDARKVKQKEDRKAKKKNKDKG